MKPIEFQLLTDELSKELRDACKPGLMPMASVKVTPSGCVMPEEYKIYAERLYSFEVREDDTWVISYPKCGTTWTQEMVWLIQNNCDFDGAKNSLLLQRFPFLEAISIIPQTKPGDNEDDENVLFADTITYVEEQPSPRFIKTHLPTQLLPKQIFTKKPKVIYVTRNPMDAAVSYYHHHRLWNGYTGSYESFMEGFLQDKLVYSPFWEHLIEYKKLEDDVNILVNSFEEMKTDLPSVIRRTAKFLKKELTEEQIEELSDHLHFTNMKNNPAINGEDFINEVIERHALPKNDPELTFIRKGQVGSWKTEMPAHLVDKFRSWTKEKLRGTSLSADDFI